MPSEALDEWLDMIDIIKYHENIIDKYHRYINIML